MVGDDVLQYLIEQERKRKQAANPDVPPATRPRLVAPPAQQPAPGVQARSLDEIMPAPQADPYRPDLIQGRPMPPPLTTGMDVARPDLSMPTPTVDPQVNFDRRLGATTGTLLAKDPNPATTRDRAVLGQPTPDGNMPNPDGSVPPTLDQSITMKQEALAYKQDPRNIVDKTKKGFWGKAGSLLKEGVIGAGAAWNANPNLDPRQRLGAALGGGIGGAAVNAIDPTSDERRENEYSIARERAQLADLQQQKQFQTEQEKAQAAIADLRAKPELAKQRNENQARRIDDQYQASLRTHNRILQIEKDRAKRTADKSEVKEVDGHLFRWFPNDPNKPMEPIIDPRTQKQAFNPANVAQEIEFEDGTKAWAKGGQIVQGKFAAERQAKQQEFTATQNQQDRQYQSAMQGVKIYWESQKLQFGAAVAREKVLSSERAKYIAAFQKENSNAMPTEEQIQKYLDVVAANEPE